MRALIVEDDTSLGFLWEETLSGAGFEVDCVTNCDAAIACVLQGSFDLCLLDMFVDDGATSGVADLIKVRTPETPVVVITGSATCPRGEQAQEQGIDWILRKPVRVTELTAIAEYLTSNHVRQNDKQARAV